LDNIPKKLLARPSYLKNLANITTAFFFSMSIAYTREWSLQQAEWVIMAQAGHKSSDMVRRYIREGSLFRENAAAEVGL
jgi:hypothetical protein